MKFPKYDGIRMQMVRDMDLLRWNLNAHRAKLTPAERSLYEKYKDRMWVEHVYWDEQTQEVVALIVDYFGDLYYEVFPSWAVYCDTMLNHILGPIE
jgi:hypothetical protein